MFKGKLRLFRYIALALMIFFHAAAAFADQGKTFYFSNLLWHVREGVGGPGPNNWSANNAWVDANGYLHLKITKVNGKWYCPEIYTDKRLGFGEYWFYIVGRVDTLDQNIVLGLFHYTTPDIGPDGTNEIDIEFSRWGDPSAFPGNYTVWPAVTGVKSATHIFNFELDGTHTTHGYVWNNKNISYKSGFGHYSDYRYLMHKWTFAPSDYNRRIPQRAMPMHLNLWLLQGRPPVNGKTVEIIIKQFCYKPTVGVGNC